ncbi:two-component system response regulator [Pseudoalteromonas luteoviolacea]|uniref:HD-GYP domain-containing protein n=1 Tax=Pseudoalteromonas luteoviolacea TaxID=43657 RepID=UPI001B3A59FC|nr:two-component system response regulator [Pseudoalteromonas luteoviolacea]MBQ4878753.1 two-component system response regulator [Pseudoalteromonas luteoviolacea]MBQ4907839.1 two-component system response regulator [Pseudoalteromonas luteoviolacea]
MDQLKTVLVVDDVKENLAFMTEIIKDKYRVLAVKSGEAAISVVEKNHVDIILLDVVMPEMNGYEVIKYLKSHDVHQEIPVIFLTAKTSVEDEEKGFLLGACDYINKPISPPILLARLNTHLLNKESKDILKNKNDYLEEEVQKRTEQMSRLQDVTIQAMASLAETRDQETGNHIRRTQLYVKLLATILCEKDKYKEILTPEVINNFYKSAPLHDIGKVGIPDNVLLKPGKLTADEFEIMKSHTVYGRNAIETAESALGQTDSFLQTAKEISHYHHEKWDGSGYPQGLKGEEIPLSARMMAIADVYDALISRRVYKDAMEHDKAIAIMREGRASHFDPELLDEFLAKENLFFDISQQYRD